MNKIILLFFLFSNCAYCLANESQEITTPFKGSILYISKTQSKMNPAILFLHGSEGGMNRYSREQAKQLAKLGYNTLFYCYFDCELSDDASSSELHNVELSRAFEVFQWLKNKNSNGIVGIYGVSRGAEMALILSSLMIKKKIAAPQFVAVHAPYNQVVPGYNRNWGQSYCYGYGANGEKSWDNDCGTPKPGKENAASYPAWLLNGKTTDVTPWSRIKIELYRGPIFITHGEIDKIWSSSRSLAIKKSIEDSRKGTKLTAPEVHIFKGQGHVFDQESEKKRWELLSNFLKRSSQR